MNRQVKTYDMNEKPWNIRMLRDIGEAWYSEFCALCGKYGGDCGNCPLGKKYGMCGQSEENAWLGMNHAKTWIKWIYYSDKLISQLKSLLDKPKEKNVKAKIRFVKFEKALAMQVLEMDERFRAENWIVKKYPLGNFAICSGEFPLIQTHELYLRGNFLNGDNNIPVERFANNVYRDKYLEKAISALKDWAKNWTGFMKNPAETAHMLRDDSKDDFVLEV